MVRPLRVKVSVAGKELETVPRTSPSAVTGSPSLKPVKSSRLTALVAVVPRE